VNEPAWVEKAVKRIMVAAEDCVSEATSEALAGFDYHQEVEALRPIIEEALSDLTGKVYGEGYQDGRSDGYIAGYDEALAGSW